MGSLAETVVVFAHEVRRSLRSAKALVLLILYGLASALSGLVFVGATRKIQENLAAITGGTPIPPETMMEMKMGGLSVLFGKDPALLQSLAEIPLIVIFFFKFAVFFLPVLIILMGFDQLSGELSSRSIRYVALRAHRGALIVGKVAAQAAVLFALTALVNVALFAYAAATTEGFALASGALAMARFWLLGLVYASAYLGLCSLCSSLFRTPVFSLLTSLCALFVFWLLALVARFQPDLSFLAYVVPSHYEEGLVHPKLLHALPSVGAYAAFAAVFLGLSWLRLRSRDL